MQTILRGTCFDADIDHALDHCKARSPILVSYGSASVQSTVERLNLIHLPLSTPLLTEELIDIHFKNVFFSSGCDALISLGGGVVTDFVKGIKWRFHEQGIHVPHIAIPTTAGSGSEATSFAVFYQRGQKKNWEDPLLVPDIVVLNPTLLLSVPRMTRIASGLDALAQSVESIWSTRSTPESRAMADQAIVAHRSHFRSYAAHPTLETSAAMQEAAFLSGKAIQITRTTLAHALSYYLTSEYKIPHGIAVFLQLPIVLHFNAGISSSNCVDSRGPDHVHASIRHLVQLFQLNSISELAEHFRSLMIDLGISSSLRDYGITHDDIPGMIQGAHASGRSAINPRRIDTHELTLLLKKVI